MIAQPSWPGRYGLGARFYDVVSLERPVYRPGRLTGIQLLDLRPGDRVLDVGCGTGLNFPLLRAAVGPSGTVVGVDRSASMLTRADRRIHRQGWDNVRACAGDAAQLSQALGDDHGFDAAVFCYSLSVITDWELAWEQTVARVRPGGRVAVVDLALPRGWGRLLSPIARFACFTGGSDPHRKPWRRVLTDTVDATQTNLRSGHIVVAAGTVPGATRPIPDRPPVA